MFASMRALAVAVLLLASLAGCGNSAPPSEQVVIDYVNNFNKAMRDDGMITLAQRKNWSERLSKFFVPNQQASQTEVFSNTLAILISFGGVDGFQIEDLVLQPVEETEDRATYKITGGDLMLITKGEKMPQPFENSGLGSKSQLLEVRRVNNEWYIVPPR